MEAIKRQAGKLRDQVTKQQQALMKQLGHFHGAEAMMMDEAQIQCHEQLKNLYNSTRATKHFQKDIVRGIEGIISVSSKQMDIVRRLAEDCCRYGANHQGSTYHLTEAASLLGTSHTLMEDERNNFLTTLRSQVCEPLQMLVRDVQLEDARILVRQYDRLWREMETQASEVLRQQSKTRDSDKGESSVKLQQAEAKLNELKSRLIALGKEAVSAMLSVEAHQQQRTFQQLVLMVHAERSYHLSVLATLEKLHSELTREEQLSEPPSSSHSEAMQSDLPIGPLDEYAVSNRVEDTKLADADLCFMAKAVHVFDAQDDRELSLTVDDIVVVHQPKATLISPVATQKLQRFHAIFVFKYHCLTCCINRRCLAVGPKEKAVGSLDGFLLLMSKDWRKKFSIHRQTPHANEICLIKSWEIIVQLATTMLYIYYSDDDDELPCKTPKS